MKAAVLHEVGQPPRYEDFAEPAAGDGEVIVEVSAAGIKPLDKSRANGTHYSSMGTLPTVCGTDGAGKLDDGTRVVFAMPRAPFGSMAQRTVVARQRCFPSPDGMDEATVAAAFNPALAAWGAVKFRAEMKPGDSVLILGATGATGTMAVQIAKQQGARRVVAAGRNMETLEKLRGLGADAVIQLNQTQEQLTAAFAREAADGGFQVILDYLWGRPTEALLAALTRHDLAAAATRTRLVEIGESAGPTITLPAAVLRSTQLEIIGSGTGSGGALDMWKEAFREVMAQLRRGDLKIEVQQVPLADVEKAWSRDQRGARFVLVP